MRLIFSLVLIVGVGLAGLAAFKTSQYISSTQAREQAALRRIVPTVEVYVANKPLPFGHVLTAEDVVRVAWPKAAMPENAFLEEEVLFPEGGKLKRTVVRQMEKFEPILAMKVTEPGEDAGVNTRLARGMRAFAIRVDANSGIGSSLRIGDRVDVYWSGNAAGLSNELQGEITKLIESGITIVAMETNPAGAARNITVEASPQQVGRLTQAQMTGRLALALVGVSDDTTAVVEDIDRRALLGIEQQEAAPVQAAEKVCTIRNRKGGEVVEIPIPCTN